MALVCEFGRSNCDSSDGKNRKCPCTNRWPVFLCRWVPHHRGDQIRLVVSDVTDLRLSVRNSFAGHSWVLYSGDCLITPVGGQPHSGHLWFDSIACIQRLITHVCQHPAPISLSVRATLFCACDCVPWVPVNALNCVWGRSLCRFWVHGVQLVFAWRIPM